MCAKRSDPHAFGRGFTLVELVMILVILGILAVVALPRLDTSAYRSAEFHDQVVAALRYAQKSAVSHRRPVCVSFENQSTLALTLDGNRDGTCETALVLPGAANNRVVSGDAANVYFLALPADLTFASDGTAADRSISINGAASAITVVGATGYVQ